MHIYISSIGNLNLVNMSLDHAPFSRLSDSIGQNEVEVKGGMCSVYDSVDSVLE